MLAIYFAVAVFVRSITQYIHQQRSKQTANINENIEAAQSVGIKLANAEFGTEFCQCWAGRVALAKMQFERGDLVACQLGIDGANRYAI